MMDSRDLKNLKDSLRIDGTDDDVLLASYLSAAKNYVKNAIDENLSQKFLELEKVSDLYTTAVYALASAYYNNRSALSATTIVPVDLTLQSIIGQLRGLYDSYQVEFGDDTNEIN
ncbi:head-tail connector protein [Pediococcus ethanolidurans]|uniref:head-tail connector protein n=1 Tax=Pediococcus ethanolidurans TaxID=319653 RepID=UPI0021A9827B|nr:head-tail connector protein [Pediococcus ethanolidurans]